MTKLRGAWGENKLVRPIFIGHDQQNCPACDHSWKPHFPTKDSIPTGWSNGNDDKVRLGLIQPASHGLTVEDAVFINYDREGMVAVGGFSKAIPAGAAYDFKKRCATSL